MISYDLCHYRASLICPLLFASSRLSSTTARGATGTPSTPLHLFIFGLEEAKADEQTTAEETEDGHVDACHAGDEGGHAHQEETSDGVPNKGDEGDAASGGEEVLYKGHIGWGGGNTRRRGSVGSGGGYDPKPKQ